MGAILGIITSPDRPRPDSQWSRSITNLQTRTNGVFAEQSIKVSHGGLMHVAYVGGFHRTDDFVVWVDGTVNNLCELTCRTSETSITNPAMAIADLFARDGTSLFSRLEGMYAIVIVVFSSLEVHLVRDRLGSKSLFYTRLDSDWAWSSEVKGLVPLQDQASVDLKALSESIHYRYLVGNRSLVAGIRQVMPTCVVTLKLGSHPCEVRYWDLRIRPDRSDEPLTNYVDRLDAVLDQHFEQLRSRYDEIGILLSGGVDSSLLAHKARQFGFRRCVAFTGKWQGDNPELPWAEKIASQLGLEHRIVPISDQDMEHRFPWLVYRMEQPPRHYNAFVLSALFEAAATEVPVVVHGEAADAIYGQGKMRRMKRVAQIHAKLRFVPKSWQRYVGQQINSNGKFPKDHRWGRIASYLIQDTEGYIFFLNRIDHRGLEKTFCRGTDPAYAVNQRFRELFYDPETSWVDRMELQNIYSSVNTALMHLDRLVMPFGLQVSLPFLSTDSIKLAASLPYSRKVAQKEVKPIVKELARRFFPHEWIDRKKQGFPTPLADWLDGPLKRWQGILTDERTRARGIINTDMLLSADRKTSSETLWTAMSLELALRQLVDGDGGPSWNPKSAPGRGTT